LGSSSFWYEIELKSVGGKVAVPRSWNESDIITANGA
jgi:hypothetical protein